MDMKRGGGGTMRQQNAANKSLRDLNQELKRTQLNISEYYASENSPMNPDRIFLPERACYYMMDRNDSGLVFQPDAACRRMENYFVGARPHESVADKIARRKREAELRKREKEELEAAKQLAAEIRARERLQRDNGDLESDRSLMDPSSSSSSSPMSERDDDDDDSMQVDESHQEEDEPLPPPPPPVQAPQASPPVPSIRRWLHDSGQARCSQLSALEKRYPFPRLVSRLNDLATYTEGLFSVVALPCPIGSKIPEAMLEPLTEEEMRVGGPEKCFMAPLDPVTLQHMLLSTQRLAETEQIALGQSTTATTNGTLIQSELLEAIGRTAEIHAPSPRKKRANDGATPKKRPKGPTAASNLPVPPPLLNNDDVLDAMDIDEAPPPLPLRPETPMHRMIFPLQPGQNMTIGIPDAAMKMADVAAALALDDHMADQQLLRLGLKTPRHRPYGLGAAEDDEDSESMDADEAARVIEELVLQSEDDIPAPLQAIKARQMDVVRQGFGRMASNWRRRDYAELDRLRHGEPLGVFALDGLMTDREFRPTTHDIRANRTIADQYSVVQETIAVVRKNEKLTAEEDRLIMSVVDILSPWQVERSDLLRERVKVQTEHTMMLIRQKNQMAAFKKKHPRLNEHHPRGGKMERAMKAYRELQETHRKERWAHNLKWCRNMHVLVREMTNASPAYLAIQEFLVKQVDPKGHVPQVKKVYINVRPYIITQQWQMDHMRTVEMVTKSNIPYADCAHRCAHQCMRYIVNRSHPALNITFAGRSGIGKSFCLLIPKKLMPEGVVRVSTYQTDKSWLVEQDFDGQVSVHEEFPSRLLFPTEGEKQTGANDVINLEKQRLTAFQTATSSFHKDEESGRRRSIETFSSQHIVTIAATNQFLAQMDDAIRRRLLLFYCMERSNIAEGAMAYDQVRHVTDPMVGNARGDLSRTQHRELFACFAEVEMGVRMGVIPELIQAPAVTFLNNVLTQVSLKRGTDISSNGHRNWIMEMARILCIQHACYFALFSPLASRLYEENVLKRWSPEMFAYLILPNLVITKEAVIHALTMLDFLYCSRDEDRLLATIALKCCSLGETNVANRRFRMDTKAHGVSEPDPNYISCPGASYLHIYREIARHHRHVGGIRAEDIRSLLVGLEKQLQPMKGLVFKPDPAHPDAILKGEVEHDRLAVQPKEQPPLLWEQDQNAIKKFQYQLCVSLEFLEKRFGFDVERDAPKDIRAKLEHAEKVLDASLFPTMDDTIEVKYEKQSKIYGELEKLVDCQDDRSPMVGPLRYVLSMPTLELSPYQHDKILPIPVALFKYWTSYLPDDVSLKFQPVNRSSGLQEPDVYVRVPVDGCVSLLHVAPDLQGPVPMLANYTRPLPTAWSSLQYGDPVLAETDYNKRRSAARAAEVLLEGDMAPPEFSHGYIWDEYDLDYISFSEQMRRLGHPGIPKIHEWLLQACYHQRPEAYRTPLYDNNEKLFREELFDLVPILDPECDEEPLPFPFAPIAYRLEQYLAREHYQWEEVKPYPAANILQRLQDTTERQTALLTNNENKAFESMSTRMGYKLRTQRAFMSRKRKRQLDDHVFLPTPDGLFNEAELQKFLNDDDDDDDNEHNSDPMEHVESTDSVVHEEDDDDNSVSISEQQEEDVAEEEERPKKRRRLDIIIEEDDPMLRTVNPYDKQYVD